RDQAQLLGALDEIGDGMGDDFGLDLAQRTHLLAEQAQLVRLQVGQQLRRLVVLQQHDHHGGAIGLVIRKRFGGRGAPPAAVGGLSTGRGAAPASAGRSSTMRWARPTCWLSSAASTEPVSGSIIASAGRGAGSCSTASASLSPSTAASAVS